MIYRLRKESGGYLSVEIIDTSIEGVVARFEWFACEKCAMSGGTWAEDEIEEVRRDAERFQRDHSRVDTVFEAIRPGVTVDGEPFIL